MNNINLSVSLFILMSCGIPGQSKIEIHSLHSSIFKNERNLRVHLPPHYSSNSDYKVLFLNDGQNVFGGTDVKLTDDWRVDEIVD